MPSNQITASGQITQFLSKPTRPVILFVLSWWYFFPLLTDTYCFIYIWTLSTVFFQMKNLYVVKFLSNNYREICRCLSSVTMREMEVHVVHGRWVTLYQKLQMDACLVVWRAAMSMCVVFGRSFMGVLLGESIEKKFRLYWEHSNKV